MEMCLNWFILDNLFCCDKAANISVKIALFILLLITSRIKQQKSIFIQPSIKIIYKFQIVLQFLIASQSVTGSTQPLSNYTIGNYLCI